MDVGQSVQVMTLLKTDMVDCCRLAHETDRPLKLLNPVPLPSLAASSETATTRRRHLPLVSHRKSHAISWFPNY